MLSEDERMEILKELEGAEDAPSIAMEALRIVQGRRGYISDETLCDIAAFLNMTPHELDSLATFYSFIFRKPVGRHVIYVCDGVTCWVMGHESIFEHLKQRLGINWGETTEDGSFTLLPVSCIGACDHAPAIMIDSTLYGDLSKEKIDEILKEHR
ncbi:MAG: NADH-quinone oxidoreductase subunit NuoE [Syntrophorhabdaceae bacterium]|nr:NADH-quinone oxidoreductase subunit NuoE [Syntrophorhabdaceae bacterium]MDD4195360.1 NADH-quinone oxidoreductase subunit NuoE [Syntrophorhabdaceae bacterium]HOD74717.1 NADH-quinone oxidoreductase subunit NuoE [Syntrophorhabdaceae bacterium]